MGEILNIYKHKIINITKDFTTFLISTPVYSLPLFIPEAEQQVNKKRGKTRVREEDIIQLLLIF
jgi:hypothetical protein